MNRQKGSLNIALILSLGMISSGAVLKGAPPPTKGDWQSLTALVPEEQILVVVNGTRSIQGRFRSVTDESMILKNNAGEQTIRRADVLRVSTRGHSHRGRSAVIGALIGAGVGLGIGAATDRSSKCGPSGPFLCGLSFNLGKKILPPVGAIAGGLVGVLLPGAGWKEVYRAH